MNHRKRWIFGLAILALLVGVWAIPAAAAPPDGPAPRSLTRAKYAYKLTLVRLDHQQDEIDDDLAAADVAQEFIADEEAAGFDTSALEAALADARARLDEAQDHHDAAALVLEEGAGFDADGNVVDPELARETMREGTREMRDAGRAIREARHEFHRAMREHRWDNREQ